MKNVSTAIWTRIVDAVGLVATPLVPSHYIALVSPLAATHTRQARIEYVKDETADTRTLTLRPGRGWRTHRAGQYVRIGVAIDGRIATRTYSISSSPDRRDGCFTITVKAQGRVSRALVRDAEVGSYVTIGLPDGDFVLPEPCRPELAFLTGGSGITPVMSMLRTLASRGELADVVHVHYARHANDVIFGDELASLAAAHPGYRLVLVLHDQDPRLFCRERLEELVPDWRERQTWACGPQGLLDGITACFTDRPDALHVERFTAAFAPAPADAEGGTVRFATSQRGSKADGRTPLLRIAEEAGVNAPHGCRMGICHTCDATLLSGCVRDLRTGERIDQAGTRVQVCVCAAAGDVELAL
jgi:ferredoxin-NADP reductase